MRRIAFRAISCFLASLLAMLPLTSRGVLIEVPGTTLADINTSISAASDGDVVRFPFTGTFDLGANAINIDKRIVFVGWTREGTIFSRAASSSARIIHLRNIPITNTNLCAIANLTVRGGPGASFGTVGVGGTTGLGRTNFNWRVHHVTVDDIRTRGIGIIGTQQGLVDHCHTEWTASGNQQGITVGFPSYVEQGINQNSTLNIALGAATNFVYVENCTAYYTQPGDSNFELYGTSRAVYRNNSTTNSSLFGIHDNTGNRQASILEVYGNSWLLESSQDAQRPNDWRAGWGVVWGNTLVSQVPGNPDTILLSVYRTEDLVFAGGTTQWYPFSQITIAPSPPTTGTSLTVAHPLRWLASQVPSQVQLFPPGVDPTPANSETATLTAYNQGTGEMTLTRGASPVSAAVGWNVLGTNMVLVVGTNRYDGNQNAIVLGYPALDMPGWGDPTTWGPTNQTQTLHGMYEWDNTFNGSDMDFGYHNFCAGAPPCGSGTPSLDCNICQNLTGHSGIIIPVTEELIGEGRDAFSDTIKPGYAPLGDHPLATEAIVTPASTNIAVSVNVRFDAIGTGGTALIWEFLENNSGGTIAYTNNVALYTAGAIPLVTDTIRYLDPHGNYGLATVTTSGDSPSIIDPGVGFFLRK